MSITLEGIGREPIKGMGGIKYFLIAQVDPAKSFETVDGIASVPVSGGYESADFKKFVCTKETGNWVETGTGTVTTNTISYEQIATLVFDKSETTKRNQVKLLGETNSILIAIDKNESAWLLGAQEGMDMTSAVSGSGTAAADLNGYTITLRGLEAQPAPFLESTTLASLI